MMRPRLLGVFIFLTFMMVPFGLAQILNTPIEQSEAYTRFSKRTQSELSKLLYLIDRFQEADAKAVYNGNYYEAGESEVFARKYLKQNYDGENAKRWIKKHCYRSKKSNELLYFRYADGEMYLMRDALLDELGVLEFRIGKFQN